MVPDNIREPPPADKRKKRGTEENIEDVNRKYEEVGEVFVKN
jgi:hypothetical protein